MTLRGHLAESEELAQGPRGRGLCGIPLYEERRVDRGAVAVGLCWFAEGERPDVEGEAHAHNDAAPRTVRREKLLGTEEATHWLADVAAEGGHYHPRFRFEHRTRFSGIVACGG